MRIAAVWGMALMLVACGGGDGERDGGRTIDADLTIPCGADGTSGPGERCACGTECADGLICGSEATSQFPGGYCIETCSLADPASCADGFECVGMAAAAFCAPRCTSTLDCDPGRLCLPTSTAGGICGPYCDEDRECTTGHCHRLSGRCSDGAPVAGAGLDERCTRHEDCQSGACSEGRCGTICSVDDPHCPDGAVCTSAYGGDIGLCHHRCGQGELACPVEGTACVETSTGGVFACTPTDGCFGRQPTPSDGRGCGCDADCDPGTTCVTEATFPIPQGGCLRDCSVDPSICPSGTVCESVRATATVACLTACATNAGCGIGRVCSDSGVCEYVCQRDDDCVNHACDLYTGRCSPSDSTRLGNGEVCVSSSQCRSGLCFTQAAAGESFCQSFCSVEQQVCPDGGICAPFATGHDLGRCLPPCATDDTCPEGSHCLDAGVPGMSQLACIDG